MVREWINVSHPIVAIGFILQLAIVRQKGQSSKYLCALRR